MDLFSYAKSPLVIENIQRIEYLRTQLLSLIISREDERAMQWENKVMHVFYSLSLYDLSIQKNRVTTTLANTILKNRSPVQEEIIHFKETQDAIDRLWYVNGSIVDTYTLAEMYRKIWKRKLSIPENELSDILMFIQKGNEHPIVQAILAQVSVYQYQNIDEKNRPFSHLVHMLMLYKHGWNLRGMVLVEHHFYIERAYFKELLSKSIESKTITPWIEYVTHAYTVELEETINRISLREKDQTIEKTFKLSERQKDILSYLSTPQSTITNRHVQKMFKVSPITASRDLAQLTKLGLIYADGKGRAVNYAKV